MVKNFDDTFSRFDTIHTCDGRTGGIGVVNTRYSIYAVARKNARKSTHSLAQKLNIRAKFHENQTFTVREITQA